MLGHGHNDYEKDWEKYEQERRNRIGIMRKLLLFVPFLLLGCGKPLDSGVVVGHEYDDEDTYSYQTNNCVSYDSNGMCSISVPIWHTETDPERYFLVIKGRAEGETKDRREKVQVTKLEYDECRLGETWPGCEHPG